MNNQVDEDDDEAANELVVEQVQDKREKTPRVINMEEEIPLGQFTELFHDVQVIGFS